LIQSRGPLSAARTAHYIAQAAEGLQYLHTAGLIHRDIKPGNMLLDRRGVIKILDLGLARHFTPEAGDSITDTYDRKAILGTADFLSPEQAIQSAGIDIRSDVYSLGATMYYFLTGRPPFPGDNFAQKLLGHQMRTPEPLVTFRPELSKEMIAIVSKMMAKRPEDRYQLPIEVAHALIPWTSEPIDPPASHEIPQRMQASRPVELSPPGSSVVRHPGSHVTISDTPPPNGHMPSSVLYLLNKTKRHRIGLVGIGMIVIAILASMVLNR
jgi:eukaryotic-like serine/threonine-protein kinase